VIADLNPYPAMKDSGVPWLGEVPGHWRTERAKWLFSRINRPVRDSDEVVTCFRDGMVTLRKNRRVRGFTESLKEIGYQGIRRGDLVIHAMDAFAGAIGVADTNGKGTPVYSVCEPRRMVDSHYYAYAIREMARSQWIQALAKGIRERSTDFRFEGFASQQVPFPPLPEQAAIVRFLDHADRRIRRYIRAKQKLIKLLEEQKQAIIHRAVTRGLDPNVRLKPSGVEWLGDVPEHWEVVPFKRRVGFQEGPGIMAADFRDEGVPLLRISCLRGSIASLQGCNFLDPQMVRRRWGHFAVRSGDYLLSASASTGNVVLATEVVAGAIPYTGILRLWPLSDRAFMPFVRLYMGCGPFQDQIDAAKSGVAIEHFGPTHLKRMFMALPLQSEQREIVEYVESHVAPFAKAEERATREIELLREYRTRLLADVVTGKLDVREAAERLPDEAAELELLDEAEAILETEDEDSGAVEATIEEADA
jgi:type I restriction enzyme S subunit